MFLRRALKTVALALNTVVVRHATPTRESRVYDNQPCFVIYSGTCDHNVLLKPFNRDTLTLSFL